MITQFRSRIADLRGRGVYAGWPNQHRAIFIHLPKTAGTSVSRALGLPTSRHIEAEVYRMANPAKFQNFYKFAFVRNPFDRLVSSYAFLKSGGMNASDARFAAEHVEPFEDFSHFVTEGLDCNPQTRAWVHFRPQVDFVCDAKGQIVMDFLGRFERLAEDYATVAGKLITARHLPITNQSQRVDYRKVYSAETLEIVHRIYRLDLETFGYEYG